MQVARDHLQAEWSELYQSKNLGTDYGISLVCEIVWTVIV